VRVGPTEDVYLSVSSSPDPVTGEVTIRVIVQPLVVWLWVGGIIMVVGTALSLFPGRRRDPTSPTSARVDDRGARRDPEAVG
jgi:cytochrome c-type biogenesis protein CcmF